MITVAQVERTFRGLMDAIFQAEKSDKFIATPTKSTFQESCVIEYEWPDTFGPVLVLYYNDRTGSTHTLVKVIR